VLVRVGSRGSRLALTQAERALTALRAPGIELALVPVTTAGDRDRSRPFGEIGSRGVFVKELEEALLDHRIDVAVHSAKDLTTSDPEGLSIGAYLARDDPRDALCGARELRPGMRVGTSSVRRKAQLLSLEPALVVEPLRGNIDTRLRKRRERRLDAVVLAACGLDRLGLAREVGHRFEPEELLPEAGQGALALQVRAGEEDLVAAADDAETRRRVEAERMVVAAAGGGCLAPLAAHHDGEVLTGLVAAEDGSWLERRTHENPLELGNELARLLASRPAAAD
jgi:hydroxymethylbilane synthase